MRIVIGIGGGIAAYKATVLLRLFSKAGHDVVAIPTQSALEFVGKSTFEALSGNPVSTSVFDRVSDVNHVRQAEEADALVIAPATADLISRLAAGRANDLLTATVLATHAPIILAPAMHTQMWEHPATQKNLDVLRSYGYRIIDPVMGRLTGPDSGLGRLPEPEDIFDRALKIIVGESDKEGLPLAGQRVLVTAGGTREALDPVRFLGNRSSGKQGVALAEEAKKLGAEVTLIHAHIETDLPPAEMGMKIQSVSSAYELHDAVLTELGQCDLLIMAAAVADFRPKNYQDYKIKKADHQDHISPIELIRNPDILRQAVEIKRQNPKASPRLIVGFAAETGSATASVLQLGQEKLLRKGCDYLAVNAVGKDLGFGSDQNTLYLLNNRGQETLKMSGSKHEVSRRLLLHVAQDLQENSHSPVSNPNK